MAITNDVLLCLLYLFFGQFDGASAYACVWEIIGESTYTRYYELGDTPITVDWQVNNNK